jgi:hypothetical protein
MSRIWPGVVRLDAPRILDVELDRNAAFTYRNRARFRLCDERFRRRLDASDEVVDAFTADLRALFGARFTDNRW